MDHVGIVETMTLYLGQVYDQCKRKTSDHGLANNVLGRRQIVICSAQGPTSISHVSAGKTWAYTILPGLVKNYSLPAQVSDNNYGTLVYTE